jgi:hypothetical protein
MSQHAPRQPNPRMLIRGRSIFRVTPPSTTNSEPVMKPLSGPTRNPTSPATSSTRPTRPDGWNAFSSALGSGPLVRIQPGLMQLTRTSGPRLIASACVNATRPPFEAE